MKHRVAILSRSFGSASGRPFEILEENGIEYTIAHNTEPENRDKIISFIGDADAVIPGSDIIDRYVLDHCPNLKCVSKHGVGLDAIDLPLAKARGVEVCCTPGANNDAVADMALLLMLAVQRNLRKDMITTASPSWKNKKLSADLFHATVGLVGYGKIGSGVAQRLSGFDCTILVYDPYIDPAHITTPNTHIVTLDELLERSDMVSLHLPLNDSTRNIIDATAIAKMKDGAAIVNTSRGGTMDYEALRAALESGHLSGAGLDVFPVEPPVNEPLLELPNVVAMPHMATYTRDANTRMGTMAAQNIVDYFARTDAT
ncbi:MAG: phosphoglycerate dehydrogenase [Oscillospiraceae bacterium]|nr:phosphoglycerate dehydrogenase [Oscillospiraceae bacterium]